MTRSTANTETRNQHCRVVVLVDDREIMLQLIAANGQVLEDEKFALRKGAPPIDSRAVCADVFSLLYQCANDGVNGDYD